MVRKVKKTVFAGLNEAGKTSILYVLQKKFSLLNSIRPTINFTNTALNPIKLLGIEITAFDLGGQKKYRDRFLKQKYHVFSDVSILYYIIDTLDEQKFEESIDYFKNIIELFENFDERPYISVLFHKVDPDRRKDKDILDNINHLKTKLLDCVKDKFEINFYKTSIHDEPTILNAFSEGLIKVNEKSTMINAVLKEFAQATFSSAVALMDENSFIIGAHYSNKRLFEICEVIAPRMATTNDRLSDYNLSAENTLVYINFNKDNNKNDNKKDDNIGRAVVFYKDFKIDIGDDFSSKFSII
ncbi:MAG: ADP-ribosylation factor-like protein, partial [Promethearchaeota archaeon]